MVEWTDQTIQDLQTEFSKIEILERTQAKIKMELKSIIRKLKGSYLGKIYEIEDRIQRAEIKAKELDN